MHGRHLRMSTMQLRLLKARIPQGLYSVRNFWHFYFSYRTDHVLSVSLA
jgi:hypothetical protein